jgi:phosphatidylinositol alpha-mannosyltransferase
MPLPVAKKKLQQTLDTLGLDVLHVQTPYSPFMGGRLIGLAAGSTAVVGTFHILPYGLLAHAGSDILGKMNTKTAKRFDAMMATSVPSQQFAGKHYGFTSVVVANPFSHDTFSETRRGKPAKRSEKKIVFLGRLVPRKGALELLKAVAYLREHDIVDVPFHVVVGGKGPEDTTLQHFVRDHDLTSVVSFAGFVPEEEKPALLASADIAVFPSTAGESFGISLLEGMAASRGVVLAGDNPGYASVVADSRQLVHPKNTEEFAGALAYWLENDEERSKMAKLQNSHVKQFDIDIIGPKIVALYEQALHKRRSL